VLFAREVVPLATPPGDGAGHPADHLLHRALAVRRAELAPEVLLGDDVGGVLRPALRELDVRLLERDPVAVSDSRVAQLPLDGVEGVRGLVREETTDRKRSALAELLTWCCVGGAFHRLFSSSRAAETPQFAAKTRCFW